MSTLLPIQPPPPLTGGQTDVRSLRPWLSALRESVAVLAKIVGGNAGKTTGARAMDPPAGLPIGLSCSYYGPLPLDITAAFVFGSQTFLFPAGQEIAEATYPAFFAAWGLTGTLTLPDARSRFAVHPGAVEDLNFLNTDYSDNGNVGGFVKHGDIDDDDNPLSNSHAAHNLQHTHGGDEGTDGADPSGTGAAAWVDPEVTTPPERVGHVFYHTVTDNRPPYIVRAELIRVK